MARLDTLASWYRRWIGYDAAEAIVLDTNDRDLMTKLNTSGGQALREWVRRGGHLVVSVGSDWLRIRDSFLLAPDDPMLRRCQRVRSGSATWALEWFPARPSRSRAPARRPWWSRSWAVEARRGKVLIGASNSIPWSSAARTDSAG